MIPTVHDIAKAADVSLATVDRVLNNRPGVRKVTYDKVQQAIKEIGYVRDISAANLARRKVYRFAFLLPDSQGPFVSNIRDSLATVETAQITDRTRIIVHSILINDPHATARIMDRFAPEDIDIKLKRLYPKL
ncbi:MAG: LacI family DNA-binding transcriptional regulator [Deltaproteobacteria bacterium]|nr:LacI family DNA-binding transcriptional regulator [Deltaproteobacteria bacterium]